MRQRSMALLSGLLVVVVANLTPPAGWASAANASCSGVMVMGAANDVALFAVAGSRPRLPFVAGRIAARPGCPSDAATCRLKSYLVAGDPVLAGDRSGAYRCATYVSAAGVETSGFLLAEALLAVDSSAPTLADWQGRWVRDREAELRISVAGDRLALQGEATFGAGDPARVRRGAIHTGDINATVTPVGNRAALGPGYDGREPPADLPRDECYLRFRLFGRYLAIDDNGGCGGLNVTFTGIYTRR